VRWKTKSKVASLIQRVKYQSCWNGTELEREK